MRSHRESPAVIQGSRGTGTKAWQRAPSFSPQSPPRVTPGTHCLSFYDAWHLEKQSPAAGKHQNTTSGLFQEWGIREDEALPLCAMHRQKLRGQTRGAVRFFEWSSPGEGLQGEGAVFFFCPNNLMKFGSSAGGIEISSRYTVCLCLINVNLPRAPSTPRAPALH